MNNPPRNIATTNAPPGQLGLAVLPRWHDWAVIVSVGVIYLAGVTNLWWPTNDSALYMSLARSIHAGNGYTFNGQFHHIVTPGLPVMLAAIRATAGDQFWAYNLMIALTGLAALVMIYLSMRLLETHQAALCVVFASAMSYTFYFNAHRILTDIPFVLAFWVMIYSAFRSQRDSLWWLVVTALAAAGGICIRAPGLLLLGPAAIALSIDATMGTKPRRRLLAAGAVVAGATAIALAAYLYARAESMEIPRYAQMLMKYLHVDTGRRFGDLAAGVVKLPSTVALMLFGQRSLVLRELGLVAIILAAVGSVGLWRRGRRLTGILLLAYPLALVSLGGGPRALRDRYLMPIQPLLVYAVMVGLCMSVNRLWQWRRKVCTPKTLLIAQQILVGFLIACNVPRISRDAFYYSALSHTDRYYEVIRHGQFAELIDLAAVMRDQPATGPIGTISDKSSIFHFLTGRRFVDLSGALTCPVDDANDVVRVIGEQVGLSAVLIDLRHIGLADAQELLAALEADGLPIIYAGNDIIVCRTNDGADSVELSVERYHRDQ